MLCGPDTILAACGERCVLPGTHTIVLQPLMVGRTHDHTLAETMLCQLSYKGKKHELLATNLGWLAAN